MKKALITVVLGMSVLSASYADDNIYCPQTLICDPAINTCDNPSPIFNQITYMGKISGKKLKFLRADISMENKTSTCFYGIDNTAGYVVKLSTFASLTKQGGYMSWKLYGNDWMCFDDVNAGSCPFASTN